MLRDRVGMEIKGAASMRGSSAKRKRRREK